MKRKILYVLILFIPIMVNAQEKYYTSYYLKESNSVNYKEENECIKREGIKLYNSYTLQRKDKGYFEYNSEYIKDENDFIEKTTYYETKKEGTIQHFYYKQENNILINKFQIRNISASDTTKIESIKIYNKNDLIYESSSDIITIYTKLIFTLDNFYNLNDIKIELEINDPQTWVFSGTLTAYSNDRGIDNRFISKRTSTKDKMTFVYLNEEEYEDLLSNITWYKTGDSYISAYPKEVKEYKYYNYEKEYLNNYTNIESTDYILDYNDYKNVYDYYERYYLILSDEIIDINNFSKQIIDTNMDINKLIINKNETDDNYIVKFKYLNDEIVKIYDKEIKTIETKEDVNNSDTVINDSNKVKTTLKIKQISNKEKTTSESTTKKKIEITTSAIVIDNNNSNNNKLNIYIISTILFTIILLLIYTKKYLKKR